jgi:hypothetical protein
LCPYGVKEGKMFVGVKSIFMKNDHVGVWEDKLLTEFARAAGFGSNFGNFKFTAEVQETKSKKNKKSKQKVTKVCDLDNSRYFITFENRNFKIELKPQYLDQEPVVYSSDGQENIQENSTNDLPKTKAGQFGENDQVSKTDKIVQEIREYFGESDPTKPLKFEIKLEKPVISDEKYKIYSEYMEKIHYSSWSSKNVIFPILHFFLTFDRD